MAKSNQVDLLSINSRVEAPFVSVEMAGLTFGVYQKQQYGSSVEDYNSVRVDYPNFIQSLRVKKNANGMVNNYTLNIVYAVTATDDPNFFEKVFSKAKKDRKIVFSYGDFNAPNFIYKKEEALITKVKTNFDSSTIKYTVSAVSSNAVSAAGTYIFPRRSNTKPSQVIKELLYDNRFGLTSIFYGMTDKSKVETNGLIAGDDAAVEIEDKQNISVLEYLNYLVNCMRSINDSPNTLIKSSVYRITVYDDVEGIYGGPYFRVSKYPTNTTLVDTDTLDYAVFDLGYTGSTPVLSFRVTSDDTFSLLYDYNGNLQQNSYRYKINNQGKVDYKWSNKVGEDTQLYKVTEAEKTWWTQLTSFPIQAQLTVRGLLRNALLMTQVKINILFYGHKHVYSGVYIVNGQEDTIDINGFQTVLSVIRVSGDTQTW